MSLFKIQEVASLKYDVKVLPFKNPNMLQMGRDELAKCIELIKANTNVPAAAAAAGGAGDGASDGKAATVAGMAKLKLHVLNYIGSMCVESSMVADTFIEHNVHKELLATIRTGANLEL